jgi:transcriptional regulator with XRE-family HTH domain
MQFKPPVSWEQRLGAEVRSLRQSLELTQAELSERADVSTSAVKYLEAGKGSSLTTFTRVAHALGRDEWLSSFSPPEATISPMALLRAKRDAEIATQRVRHPSNAKRPT